VTQQAGGMNTVSITERLLQMHPNQVRSLFLHRPQSTARWMGLLAFEGMPHAQLYYGQMLLEGIGVAKDERAGLSWFKQAASQNNLDAINMTGRCLENGWGCTVDVTLAATYYQRAANAGHAWALYNLGHLYLDGLGIERDMQKAHDCYLQAAMQGHARAMNLVGRCSEQGWGTPKNVAAAADWYRRSAEAGYFRGQYNWASILAMSGRTEEAIAWFEKAMTAGTPAVHEAARQCLASLQRHASSNTTTLRCDPAARSA
jgi:TPR repeat protein